jgi:hypothetical protein
VFDAGCVSNIIYYCYYSLCGKEEKEVRRARAAKGTRKGEENVFFGW